MDFLNNVRLIQGGMGVYVSNWRLARAVSELGHLGVVSGTCLDTVLIRRLADGDPGGHGGLADHRACRPCVGGLSARHRVITPDLRSSGKSWSAAPLDFDVGGLEAERILDGRFHHLHPVPGSDHG